MSGIINRIRKFFLLRKKRQISKDIEKLTKNTFVNTTTKTILANGSKATFNAQTQDKIREIKENVSAIVKTTKCEPELLLNYVRAAKTPIFRMDSPNKLLAFIGEEEGFICPQEGLSALILSIFTGQGFKLKTEAIFVLRKDDSINKSYLLHNFHRWYSMKSGLGGFDYNSRRKLKMFIADNSKEAMKRLSMESIMEIQEAISREREANAFVLEYENQIEGSKKVLEKIKNDGGAEV